MPTSQLDRERLRAALRNAHAAGDTAAATKIANRLQAVQLEDSRGDVPKLPIESADSWQPPERDWAATEMSPVGQLAAGFDTGLQDLNVGTYQMANPNDPNSLEIGKEHKARHQAINNTFMGQAGNTLAKLGIAVPAALATASAGIPAAAAATLGLAGNALFGAAEPTSEPGERTKNAEVGAALMMLPEALKRPVKALLGAETPARVAAANTLKRYGIDTAAHDVAPGILSRTSRAVLGNVPIAGELYARTSQAKEQKIVDALYNSIGVSKAPANRIESARAVDAIGDELNNVGTGMRVPLDPGRQAVTEAGAEYRSLFPENRNPKTGKAIRRAEAALTIPNASVRGEALRRNYLVLRGRMSTAKDQTDRSILSKLLDAYDTSLDSALVGTGKEGARQELSQNYRVAKALSEVPEQEGGLPVRAVVNRLREEQVKGPIKPSTQAITNAANELLPAPIGGTVNSATEGLTGRHLPPFIYRAISQGPSGYVAFNHPFLYSGLVGASAATRAATKSGIPQYLANDPEAQRLIAAAIRAKGQTELSQ